MHFGPKGLLRATGPRSVPACSVDGRSLHVDRIQLLLPMAWWVSMCCWCRAKGIAAFGTLKPS
eukprot:10174538-Alexandrium_andersonii.AAC.1